jgi:hypothetical protein
MCTRLHLLLFSLLAFGAACISNTGTTNGVFRGIYINAFEASAFRPCSEARAWWTAGDLAPVFAAWEAQGPVAPWDARAAYLVVRARRSKKGGYGHLDSYPYELHVDQVLEVRIDTMGVCR